MKSKFTWIFTLLLAFFIQFAFAQEKTVTGVVTDNDGMPTPGVTVMVKGNPASAVTTDIDGKYAITASVGQTIVFTYVSMQEKTVTVGAANSYNVIMAEEIDEVVITSYKTTARPLSNDAITTITAKTIEGRPNANFIQTLQAQVPGLNISTGSGQPGSNSTVILRGYGSINGNVEPLYIIDGVPLAVDNFRSINPNDIESVSVLKDAGATAIYGNRGANGVIVVTTKKGSFESPLNIKYNGITSFTTIQDNKYHKMNASQLLTLEKAYGEGYGASLTDEQIAAFGGGTDWYDEIFRTGVSQNHVLSLTSGGKNLASFTSFGYFDQEGILQGTGLKRFNFRNNLNGKSNNDKFSYNTSLTINYSQRTEASNLGQGSVNINPVLGANQGVPYISPSMYTNGADLLAMYEADPTDPSNIGAGTLLLSPLMLLDRLQTGVFETNELKMIANVQANYKVTDDVTAGITMGTDFTENMTLQAQDPNSFNSLLFQNPGEEYLGWQYEGITRDFAFNFNANLNYNKTFAEKHTLDVSVFTEYYKAHFKSFNYQQNGLDPKVWEPGNGAGFIGHVPFPEDGEGSPAFYVPEVGSSKASAGLFSYFGTVDYDYDNKYGFGATVRRDASYRFSESNRWGTFWSVSGRWNIDQESFMEGSKFDLLKLRASYGTTGNQNISGQSIYSSPNLPRTLYALSPSNYANLPAYVLGQIGNADVKWETVEQANIGLDFEVFQKRLRGQFEVYQRTTKDLFQGINISGVNGTYSIDGNNGDMRNSGVEAMLSYDVVRDNDFTFTLNFNGSYNKNKVLDIPAEGGVQDEGLQVIQEGRPLLEYYAIRYAGVNPANGNLLFLDANGDLTENPDPETDRVLTGKTFFPIYQGGFGFDASYKGFFLTTQFSYVADIWRYDYDLEGLQDPNDIGVFNKSQDLNRAWTPDNRVTDIPSLFLTNKGFDGDSDRYLKDASYVRLRYASLGYNFSREMLDKTPFSGIRAYFQAENLFTWTKWRGWDAESNRAADQYQYPTPRILSIGLEVQF